MIKAIAKDNEMDIAKAIGPMAESIRRFFSNRNRRNPYPSFPLGKKFVLDMGRGAVRDMYAPQVPAKRNPAEHL